MEHTVEHDRKAYISGLRTLADLLADHPELPLPHYGSASELSIFTKHREELVSFARLLPGKVDKKITDSLYYGFELHAMLDGLRLLVYGKRADVCERIVTGTRQVTVTEPDPEAVAALPQITRTTTVEDVEWVCGSLLADRPATHIDDAPCACGCMDPGYSTDQEFPAEVDA